MNYYRDLREYVAALEKNGKVTRILRKINKDTQLLPLVRLQFRGLPEEKRSAFLFENVTDRTGREYDSPVLVGALAGSPQIYALGLRCRVEEIPDKLAKAQLNPIEPRMVNTGPVQEEIHLGKTLLEHGGLDEFPIPLITPGFDPAPYITPYWVSKDPDSGIPNVGMYRVMLKSSVLTGINFMTPNQGGAIHYNKCKKRGKPLEAAIVIGGSPSVGYVAVSPLPVDANEFAVAGGIAGEPLEMVKCQTIDLEVPATAEIVIEGEVTTAELEPEAPFGEYTGFMGLQDLNPYFSVKCITHRKQPIWLSVISQYPPNESTQIRKRAFEATLYKHLRYDLKMSHVKSVAFFEMAGSDRLIVEKLGKTSSRQVWKTLEASAERFPRAKIIIAVDEDVNIQDLDSVCLTVCMRTQPHRDYRIDQIPAPSLGDYSLEPMDKLGQRRRNDITDRPPASRLLIDATMKWPYPPQSLPRKEFMEEALEIWREEGLPELNLKEPWWGLNFGFWNQENEELAMAAAKGEYFKAGEVYSRRRSPAQ